MGGECLQPQNRISRDALTVWRITAFLTVVFIFLLFIGYVILSRIFDFPIWIAVTLFIFIIVYSIFTIIIFPKIRWERWRYEVFEYEIDIQYGKFIVRRVLIPMVRVQHVDTVQGPILRKYGLATVTISTAATIHEIPALDIQEATKLRDTISRLARVVDEDA
jgi:membrane protein YdbS with pleckstrin-like domain